MSADRAGRIRKILSDLVGFNTVSDRSNLPLIDYIEKYLAAFGISGRRLLDGTGQKASLWVTIGPQDRPGLVLSGHTDVVPVERQPWTSDPFTTLERNGRYYGRGTTDMKGFVAVCLAMVPEIRSADLKTPIHLAISYDEEVGCVGVRPMLREIAKASSSRSAALSASRHGCRSLSVTRASTACAPPFAVNRAIPRSRRKASMLWSTPPI